MRFSWFTPAAVSAVLVAAACSDATGPGSSGLTPDAAFQAQVTTDLAPSAGEDFATDYEFASAASASSTGATGSFDLLAPAPGALVSAAVNAPTRTAAWISSACTFNASSGSFSCPPVQRRGHTFTVRYVLKDASGAVESAYDKVTTASIAFTIKDTAALAFTSNGNSFSDTTSRNRSMTVSGLAGDPDTVHTWNGNGSGTVHSARTGQITKAYVLVSTDTITGVRYRQPRDINPYPLSGIIVRNYTVTRTRMATDTVQRTATRRAVVTFNGSANVPMVVTRGDGSTASFTLNLDTHKVTPQ